jgi:maltose alpha-D-glucosyltransferase/alpha-amylase
LLFFPKKEALTCLKKQDGSRMIDRNDLLWFKDAIFYQLHPKTFSDSNADGFGDFPGITSKLDYLQQLGINAIWVMPFYQSPLRDGGYDISDFRAIDPTYGTLEDFQAFLDAAHERGIRIVTELVINHTSDQHPWFQAARRAPAGSPERSLYVWSDTVETFKDARIIFIDSETSNWTWDPVAKQFYWHRFYSHQPDLNYDNPQVIEEVLSVMRFWLDMGVDGLRLDAIPYLVERDGTTCENLPETHDIIKRIRATMEAEYPDRLLLAEANQWPEDTAAYFAGGDECHMAFHFPLMPRMYMALAQEDRHPISDIMRQTPEIPPNCQWGIFLRNHDELTLEMVTSRDRDYLWSFYASDVRMRSNLGIRRRLAPLLENDRRKIEFMVSLLMSFPGTPFLYYGDEIGMGDNIYLGDRDGVRTPMQWSPDRNGGFSRAHPGRLFLPVNQDPVYGSDVINVEAQQASPFSLLNWFRRVVFLRKQNTAVFARGSLRFLYPRNRKVLAYLREYQGETILCVANVSRSPQAVELDLAEFNGFSPTEMTGQTVFPSIGELPYLLTLPAYGSFWFRLTMAADEEELVPSAPELFTLVQGATPESLFTGREIKALETEAMPRFLGRQVWFRPNRHDIAEVHFQAAVRLPHENDATPTGLALFDVTLRDGETGRCLVPLSLVEEATDELLPRAIAQVRKFNQVGLLIDALDTAVFADAVLAAASTNWGGTLSDGATVHFAGTEGLQAQLAMARTEARSEVENQVGDFGRAVAIGDHLVVRVYRYPTPGPRTEIAAARYLWANGYRNVPQNFGTLNRVGPDGQESALIGLFAFVRSQGTVLTRLMEAVRHELEAAALAPAEAPPDRVTAFGSVSRFAQVIGTRVAELHAILGNSSDPRFNAERYEQADFEADRANLLDLIESAFEVLNEMPSRIGNRLLARQRMLRAAIRAINPSLEGATKAFVHGNLELGRILVVQDDVVLAGLGVPKLSPGKDSPTKRLLLEDLASVIHSFATLVGEAADTLARRYPEGGKNIHDMAIAWLDHFKASVFSAYEASGGKISHDPALLRLLLIGKAVGDTRNIALRRPDRLDWLDRYMAGLSQPVK